MEFSKTLRNNIEFMVDIINSCETVDQLENSKRMIDFFCSNNKQNDKIPFAKSLLIGNLMSKARQIER